LKARFDKSLFDLAQGAHCFQDEVDQIVSWFNDRAQLPAFLKSIVAQFPSSEPASRLFDELCSGEPQSATMNTIDHVGEVLAFRNSLTTVGFKVADESAIRDDEQRIFLASSLQSKLKLSTYPELKILGKGKVVSIEGLTSEEAKSLANSARSGEIAGFQVDAVKLLDSTGFVASTRLMRNVAKGNRSAVDEFLEMFEPELLIHIRSELRKLRRSSQGAGLTTGLETETRSILHDLYEKLLRLLSDKTDLNLDNDGSLPGYLRQMARHLIIDRIRATKKKPNRQDIQPDELAAEANLAFEQMSLKEVYEQVKHRSFEVLSDTEKAILELKLKEQSNRDIGEKLKISEANVRARYSDAIKKLRGTIAPDGEEA
jgi:RNA polymerase sigma factor (sigma-70 family)